MNRFRVHALEVYVEHAPIQGGWPGGRGYRGCSPRRCPLLGGMVQRPPLHPLTLFFPPPLQRIDIFELSAKKRDRCLSEVQLLTTLRHPNIIAMVDAFIADKCVRTLPCPIACVRMGL